VKGKAVQCKRSRAKQHESDLEVQRVRQRRFVSHPLRGEYQSFAYQ
jgi:hypothetical protein